MTEYHLDGRKMTDVFSAHGHMTEGFHLSPEESRSLDGLWEGLCRLPVPFHLTVSHWSQAETGLEDYADELMDLFCDLVEEEPEFSFEVSD